MSIASMTEIAFQSRADVGKSDYYPKTYTEIAGAAGGKDTRESEINAALRNLTTYIPSETLTLYVAILSVLRPEALNPKWVAFWCFLIATPAVICIVYIIKAKMAGKRVRFVPKKWPVWEMTAGTIAYMSWAFALPGSPFGSFGWYSSGLAGIVVLITSTILGLIAPLFARQLKP